MRSNQEIVESTSFSVFSASSIFFFGSNQEIVERRTARLRPVPGGASIGSEAIKR